MLTILLLTKNIQTFIFLIQEQISHTMLQIFPFLGASRNYFVCLILMIVIATFMMAIKMKKGWIASIAIYTTLLIVFLFLGDSLLSKVLLRIISVDERESLINSLLSGRASLQERYLSDYLLHPDSFIFGRGFGNSLLSGDSAHSVFVMSFRYFGIIGTVLYYYYISSFVDFEVCKDNKLLVVPILLLLIYGITIDYISYSEMTLFLLFIYSQSFFGIPKRNEKSVGLNYEKNTISI